MKGCMKDFSNILDSNRERVAFTLFGYFFIFKNIAVTRLSHKLPINSKKVADKSV